MATTIYASFNDIEQAEKAAGALLDRGVNKEDLSLVANGGYREAREQPITAEYYTTPSVNTFAATPSFEPSLEQPAGYPIEQLPRSASTTVVSGERYNNVTLASDAVEYVDGSQAESVAKAGITTTTAEDAGAGAVKGTEIGLGIGILAGIASLIIPGVGLVIGGGALAIALGAAALTTGAGAAVGGIVGYLVDQGVDETNALRYKRSVEAGGALVAITLPSNGVDLQEAELVLSKYGAVDITTY